MSVPCQIAAGATLLFTESNVGYPATLYTLAFSLNIQGSPVTGITSSANGTGYIVTAPASATGAWTPGRYFWSEVFTKTSDSSVYQGCTGQLSVTPNYAAQSTPTAAQVQLAALDTAITSLINNPYSSTSFNGQTMTMKNLKEMFDMRDRLQARVDFELRAMGLSTRGGAQTIVTRFTNG